MNSGDGCSSSCVVEPNFVCAGMMPSDCSTTINGTGFRVPPTGSIGTASGNVNAPLPNCLVRDVQTTFRFSPVHTFAGDMRISLQHGATTVVLSNRVGGASDLSGPYTFADSA